MNISSERELARAGEIYQRTLELVEAKVVKPPVITCFATCNHMLDHL